MAGASATKPLLFDKQSLSSPLREQSVLWIDHKSLKNDPESSLIAFWCHQLSIKSNGVEFNFENHLLIILFGKSCSNLKMVIIEDHVHFVFSAHLILTSHLFWVVQVWLPLQDICFLNRGLKA